MRSSITAYLLFAGMLLHGCATVSTVSNPEADSPKVYSGTRLDLHAMKNNELAMMKFGVEPPNYPGFDLPASFLLDTLLFPLTSSYALYYTIIE